MFEMNQMLIYVSIISLGYLHCCTADGLHNTTDLNQSDIKILSRRKRFLIFPEGSSLQLVFCLNLAATIEIGDIFLWGTTAALAWELPQDPYSPFDHRADPLHRRMDKEKSIYYTDERGKLISKVPYKRKAIINPAFAKRSVQADNYPSEEKSVSKGQRRRLRRSDGSKEAEIEIDRKRMHEAQVGREFLKIDHMNAASVEFHRHSRKDLYEKLEDFLEVLGLGGRECVLKTLCEVGSSEKSDQGTFVDEMIRAVFTLPKGSAFDKDHHKEYDVAHKGGDCEKLFPGCHGSIRDLPL